MARQKTRGTTEEIAKAFAEGKAEPHRNHGSTSHAEGIFYSYNQPIARLLDGKCLFDVDRYSVTTDRHQREVRDALNGANVPIVEVSQSALRRHNINFQRGAIDLLESTDGVYVSVYKNKEDYNHIPERYKDILTFDNFESVLSSDFHGLGVFSHTEKDEPYESKTFHVTGSSLIRSQGKVIWSSIDTGDYFACELSDRSVSTIDEAMLSLRPHAIRDRNDLLRQGEWLFAPVKPGTYQDAKAFKSLIKKWVRLNDRSVQGWPVNCGRLSWNRRIPDSTSGHHTVQYFIDAPAPLVSGKVKDRQHGLLDLGNKWYEAYHNTQVISYSASQTGTRID